MQESTKNKILAIVGAIFTVATALGSTLLIPEQRDLIMKFIAWF